MNDLLQLIITLAGTLGGFELVKFLVTNWQNRRHRAAADQTAQVDATDKLVEFYKSELSDLELMYKRRGEETEKRINSLADLVDKLKREVSENNKRIDDLSRRNAELESQMKVYKCNNLDCPARNRGQVPPLTIESIGRECQKYIRTKNELNQQ